MKPFDCIRARTVEHALAVLAQYGSGARLLAGGTDLLVELKSAAHMPRVVLDIAGLDKLKRIEITRAGLRIGAGVTHSALLDSALVNALCPALAAAAHAVGAVQTRNLGTVGGNLVSGVPSMDTGPVLLALDACVDIAREDGSHRLPLERFFVGPRQTALRADELLLDIIIPSASFSKPASFLKFGLRGGQALALVNVAAGFFVKGEQPVFSAPRIALGAVAPTVIRAYEAEKFLDGRAIDADAIEEAARLAAAATRPISDFRASAAYRREVAAVLVRRALETALERARAVRTRESPCL